MPNFQEQGGIFLETRGKREKIVASLENTGLAAPVNEKVIDRLVLLEQGTEFNEDARQVERGMVNVFNFLKEHFSNRPELNLTAEQQINGRASAILHDIGKSGPADATLGQQQAVVKLFSIEGINGFNPTVGEIVAQKFSPEEGEELLKNLSACAVRPEMTMKQFWSLHAKWTRDILGKYPDGLDENIQIISGSHHLNNNIDLSDPAKPRTIKTSGDEADNLLERILMVVDQYQAAIRRSNFKLKHEDAIRWVHHNLAQFKDDDLLKQIIDAVDELGKQDKIFV